MLTVFQKSGSDESHNYYKFILLFEKDVSSQNSGLVLLSQSVCFTVEHNIHLAGV
jgi:hypothetical protein